MEKQCAVSFFRATDTSGSVRLDIHAGDGTADINCRLSGNSSSYVNALGVAPDAPQFTLDVAGPDRSNSYDVAGQPSPSPAAQIVYISDETSGSVLAYSDGSDWRRVTDGAIVS